MSDIRHDPIDHTSTIPLSETVAAYLIHLIRTDAASWPHRRLRREEALAVADALYETLTPRTRAALDRLDVRTERVA